MPASPYRLKRRRTKIVATLGPASSDPATLAGLIDRGVDVFRLNMSHGTAEVHRATAQRVREAADAAGTPVAILVDLCGPKIRVGRFPGGGIELTAGAKVTVTTRPVDGAAGLIPSQYPTLADDVAPGHRILLDDGQLELRVEDTDGTDVTCTVVHGGRLTDHKGMNLPDGELSVAALTDKDRADVGLALELGADLIALSFVRRAADVAELRGLLPADRWLPIVAKIERPEALANIEEILAAADAIMVARGDLGVELPPETLPGTQDELVEAGRRRGKPVIIATQMLDSMIRQPRPTRAEVVDVAYAVTSGADAVMLSGETAVGAYPLETVAMMDRVIRDAEGRLWSQGEFHALALAEPGARPMPLDDGLRRAVTRLSRDLGVRAILVVSRSGRSGTAVCSARPAAPVVAVTDSRAVGRFFCLCWGIVPIEVEAAALDSPVELLRRLAPELGLAEPGHCGLIVQGFRDDERENLPSVTVAAI